MASIVVSGDTSGSVTISAPAVAGTTTLTLPTTSGTIVTTAGATTVQFAAGSAAAPSITFTGDTNTGIFSPTADTIAFSEGGVESMRIDSSGNVGIGNSNPQAKLQVTGAILTDGFGSSANNYYSLRSGYAPSATGGVGMMATDLGAGNADGLGLYGQQGIRFFSSTSERMRITSGGKVLIGSSTSPSATGIDLLVNNSAASYIQISKGNSGGGVIGVEGPGLLFYSYTGNIGSETYTERMRITSDGDLLIGTLSTPSTAGGSAFIAATNNRRILYLGTNVTAANNVAQFYNANGSVGSITTDGSSTAFNTSSDYRLKENIAPMTGALDIVAQLKPCTYTWKSDGSVGQGFIAHELQAVVPDCVTGEKDEVDEEGNPVYQGVDTSFLVATLTAAIQELNAKVEAQAAEIQALKGAQ